jgi:hypothetical protein
MDDLEPRLRRPPHLDAWFYPYSEDFARHQLGRRYNLFDVANDQEKQS